MFTIVDGRVEIREAASAAMAKSPRTLKNGDLCGEMSVTEKKRRSATAVTTKLLVINAPLLEKMIDQNPDFSKRMIRILSERL